MSARFAEFWREYRRSKRGVVGLFFLGAICVVAILAPLITWHPPLATGVGGALLPPQLKFPFGTDNLGRDIFSGVLFGARTSLIVGAGSMLISTTIGVIIGALAGYFGGWLDDVLMRITEVFLVIPSFFLALVIVFIFGQTISNMIIAIAVTTWPSTARLLRAEFLSIREREFVDAARIVGESDTRIIFSEILPNAISPVIVNSALQVATNILIEAGLSFLGVGDQNVASWGRMLNNAEDYLIQAPWMALFPGGALFLTTLSVNLFADSLNDLLNPKKRHRE